MDSVASREPFRKSSSGGACAWRPHIGLAARQLDTIDRSLDYDLRIDTSARSPQEAAERMLAAFAEQHVALERARLSA